MKKRIQGHVVLLKQDCYYRDNWHPPFAQRVHINYDEPATFEHDELLRDVHALLEVRCITRKGYDYANHCRADGEETIEPGDVLIIEGIHVFYDERLHSALNLKLYKSVDPDICLLRRMQRDITECGRDIDGVAQQYMDTMRPIYNCFIRGYIEYADLIVVGGGKNQMIVDILVSYLNGAGSSEQDGR